LIERIGIGSVSKQPHRGIWVQIWNRVDRWVSDRADVAGYAAAWLFPPYHSYSKHTRRCSEPQHGVSAHSDLRTHKSSIGSLVCCRDCNCLHLRRRHGNPRYGKVFSLKGKRRTSRVFSRPCAGPTQPRTVHSIKRIRLGRC